MTRKLLIEGWRGISQSYAMVNQYQMLALANLGIDFYHHDLPFFNQDWNQQRNNCGFEGEEIKRLSEVKKFTRQDKVSATYRISYPYRLYPSECENLFVFGTSEYQMVSDDMVFDDGLGLKYAQRPLTIITPSSWSKIGFLRAGFRDEQVKVVPHGVNLEIFRPLATHLKEAYRNSLGATKDDFIILSVGGMTFNKGIDVLLTAYLRLKNKYPHIRLVLKDQRLLYGVSANNIINEYCHKKGINLSSNEMQEVVSSFFVISENLTLNQLNGLYNAANCYVSPYRAEGFNIPPLEAAAAGIPVVVTKGGSTDDYVDDSFAAQIESTLIVKDKKHFLEPEVDSLIAHLSDLIENKNKKINFVNTNTWIKNRFTWQGVTKKLVEEYLPL